MHLTRALALPSVACVLTTVPVAAADDKVACIEASEVGQSHRDARKFEDARKSFIACSRDVCPKLVREACEGWLSEVAKAQPTVVFAAQDREGRDVRDVRVLVDGKQVLAALTGHAMPVDPGTRRVSFLHPRLGALDVTVLVLEGEKGRAITGVFGRQGSVGGGPSTKPAASADAGLAAIETPRARTGVRDAGPSDLPYIVAGAGAVALVASGYFYLSYSSKKSSLATACGSDGLCPASEEDNIESARQAGRLTVIMGVLGVGGLGVGAWLYSQEKEAKTRAAVGVTPSGAPFATISGRF